MDFTDIMIITVPFLVAIFIILSSTTGIEDENKKRTAKGEPALTENEYQRKIKNSRVMACIILVVSFVIAVAIIAFVK